MSIILSYLEGRLQEFVHSSKKQEDWKEKAWNTAESMSGLKRERLIVSSIVLTFVYIALGSVLPLISHIACTIFPVIKSFKLLNKSASDQTPQLVKNALFYWILFSIWTIFDFSPLVNIPFYYLVKTVFFIYLYLPSTSGIEKVGNKLEPIVKIAENWFSHPTTSDKDE